MKLKNIELKPCSIYGGKAEFKKKRRDSMTIGAKSGFAKEERYIRCSTCHAKTRSVTKIDNAVNCWDLGEIYSVK